MKNLFKTTMFVLAVSVSLVACKGSGSKDGSDTAKADSSVKIESDSTVKTDTVRKDSAAAATDTSKMKKDTISVKKTVTKTEVKKATKN